MAEIWWLGKCSSSVGCGWLLHGGTVHRSLEEDDDERLTMLSQCGIGSGKEKGGGRPMLEEKREGSNF